MSNVSSKPPVVTASPGESQAAHPFMGVTWGPLAAVLVTVVSVIVGQIGAGIIIGIVLGFLQWDQDQFMNWMNTTEGRFVYVVVAEAMTVAILWGFFRHNKISLRALGFHRGLRWRDLGYALGGFGVYFVLYILVVAVAQSAFDLNTNQEQELGFNSVASSPHLLMAFVSLVILPPIVEELVFRGFLYGGLRRKLPMGWAMLFTALLFAAPHLLMAKDGGLLWVAAVDTFVLSFVLCYLREKTGNLWASIGVHTIKNGLAFLVLFVFVV